MRQAVHILKKDVLYLRPELLVFGASLLVFAWADTLSASPLWAEMLVAATACYLIARLIHAEAIPGANQFWITRPYRWKSLIGAKLLFLLVFINLPILVVRLLILTVDGFSLTSVLPALFWSQCLIFAAVCLPLAALGAVTANLGTYIPWVLWVVGAGFVAQQLMVPEISTLLYLRTWPSGVEWVRNSVLVLALAGISVTMLYAQYRSRKTFFSRVFALSGVTLAIAVYWNVPLQLAMSVQSNFSKQQFEEVYVEAVIPPANGRRVFSRSIPAPRPGEKIRIPLPMILMGIPDGIEVQPEAFNVTLESPDGRRWSSDFSSVKKTSTDGATRLEGYIAIDADSFNAVRDQSLSLHGSLYLTFFGNPEEKTIQLQKVPVDGIAGLQCYMRSADYALCRAALRWPALLISAKMRNNPAEGLYNFPLPPYQYEAPVWPLISYSPFATGLRLSTTEEHLLAGKPREDGRLTLISREPVAHLRRDIEIRNFRLNYISVDYSPRPAALF